MKRTYRAEDGLSKHQRYRRRRAGLLPVFVQSAEEVPERRRARDRARDHATMAASARERYARNRTMALARATAYRVDNRDLLREKSRAYFRAHPESNCIYATRRRARLAGAIGSHTVQEWSEKIALFGGCCSYCGRDDRPLTRDHVVPLLRGGSDYIANIVPACKPCNSAKGTRTPKEFLAVAAEVAA